jgi:hypothetical protein
MPLSIFDSYYDDVSVIAKKVFFDEIPLKANEKKLWKKFLKLFKQEVCEDLCRGDTCRFASPPDEWVKYLGYEDLCCLIKSCSNNNRKPPPKNDILKAKQILFRGLIRS